MTDDIDPTYDEDFPYPHLDPLELGDIRPSVKPHKDYASMTRGNNYPFDENIDYDPRIDNVDDDWSEDE